MFRFHLGLCLTDAAFRRFILPSILSALHQSSYLHIHLSSGQKAFENISQFSLSADTDTLIVSDPLTPQIIRRFVFAVVRFTVHLTNVQWSTESRKVDTLGVIPIAYFTFESAYLLQSLLVETFTCTLAVTHPRSIAQSIFKHFWFRALSSLVLASSTTQRISAGIIMSHRSMRIRNLGYDPGDLPTGPDNSILDVPGVHISQVTVPTSSNSAAGCTATKGVTVICPRPPSEYYKPCIASIFTFNGNGELTGAKQIADWGYLR